MRPAVFVTGATGFVGSALVGELVRRGHEVFAFARASSDRANVTAGLDANLASGSETAAPAVRPPVWAAGDSPGAVHWLEGDLRDAASLERALATVCAAQRAPWVVHSAAVISYRTRDRELQRSVNVEGTRNVLAACRRHPVGRVLHVSSVVAVGHARADQVLDEDAPFNGAELRCDYTDTKRAAEELALAAPGLDLVVVNPGAIFGPGARGPNTVKFLRQLARGPKPPFVPPGSLSVVGVDDVVAGCVLALERGTRGRRYLLTESVWSSLDSFQLAASVLGVPPPVRIAPRVLWKALELGSRAVDLVASPELLTPQAIRMLGAHFRFDSARARAELGWRPRPFVEVLRGTVEWMRARALI